MDAHGNTACQNRILEFVPDPQFIFCMAALMDHRVHRVCHAVFFIIGSNADILIVKLQSKGMLRLPDGAMASVQPHDFHQVIGKSPL